MCVHLDWVPDKPMCDSLSVEPCNQRTLDCQSPRGPPKPTWNWARNTILLCKTIEIWGFFVTIVYACPILTAVFKMCHGMGRWLCVGVSRWMKDRRDPLEWVLNERSTYGWRWWPMLRRAWFLTRTQGNLSPRSECLGAEIQRSRRAVYWSLKQKNVWCI